MMVTAMVRALVALVVVIMVCVTAEKKAAGNAKDPRVRNLSGADSDLRCSDCPVCETEECIATAARILDSLDTSTDPCHDFYQFACGGWKRHRILPPYRSRLEAIDDIDRHVASARSLLVEEPKLTDLTSIRKAKNLYTSCIFHIATESENDDSIVEVIDGRFGTWPLSVDEWDDDEFDLERFLTQAIRLGVHPLIRLEVETNYEVNDKGKSVGSHVLKLKHPELGLPAEAYWDTSVDDLSLKIYRDKIYADVERFGIEDSDTALEDVKNIVEVERTLAEMFPREENEFATSLTLAEVQENYGQLLNWTRFLITIMSSPDIGITDITADEIVIVDQVDYFYLGNMTEYFSQVPARTQANYILWRVLDSLENVLVAQHTKTDFVLNHVVYGITALPSPEEACVTYVSKVFKLVLHRLLYADKFPPEERKIVYDIMKRIQREFDEVVDEHEWVDEHTASVIKEKNAALAMTLMYLEQSLNDTFLENFYANVTVSKYNFRDNVVSEREETMARNLRLLRKPYEYVLEELPHEWVAQNNFEKNQMEFTSTVFEPPLFIIGVPQAINYGGMGTVFSHEVLHAFDNSGYKYNREGIEGNWWSNETISSFHERQQCMVDQYNKFFYTDAMKFVDGQFTLGENIADNSGLKLAYRAYKKYTHSLMKQEPSLPGVPFSDDKLFFINFAQLWCGIQNKETALAYTKDEHTPPEFRVKGTIQNSKDFPRVFNCPVGSPMNPDIKCEVW